MVPKYSLYRVTDYFHPRGVILLEGVQLAVDVDNDDVYRRVLFESLGERSTHFLVRYANGSTKVLWVGHHNIGTDYDSPILQFGYTVPPDEFTCIQLDKERFVFSFSSHTQYRTTLPQAVSNLESQVGLTHFGRA